MPEKLKWAISIDPRGPCTSEQALSISEMALLRLTAHTLLLPFDSLLRLWFDSLLRLSYHPLWDSGLTLLWLSFDSRLIGDESDGVRTKANASAAGLRHLQHSSQGSGQKLRHGAILL